MSAPSDRRVSWALALLALVDVAAAAPVLSARAAAAVFFDDGFYYFQIARNVARGAGFTFDGVHATNGFHPLWLFALVPLFRLLPGDLPPLVAVLALEGALVAAATVVVYRALRAPIGALPAAAAALLLLAQPGALRIMRGGVEGPLVLCLLAVVWARWLTLRDDAGAPLARWWALGACCALLVLARLEAAVAVLLLAVLTPARLREAPARALALAAPAAACLLVYLLWSRWTFGLWGPVSAFVKTRLGGEAWARQTFAQRLELLFYVPWGGDAHLRRLLATLGVSPATAFVAATLLSLAALAAIVWHRHRLLPRLRASGAAFVLLAAAAMMAADKASVRLLVDWYRAPALLAVALVGGVALAGRPRLARIAVAVLAVVALARAPQVVWETRHRPGADPALQAALWLRPRLAAGERAGSWNAGLLGYFAGGGVVNLDGLVNDRAFLNDVLRGGDLAGYLERERVLWLADVTTAEARLAPLVRRYPPPVASQVEARYHAVAAFTGACDPASAGCSLFAIWERR